MIDYKAVINAAIDGSVLSEQKSEIGFLARLSGIVIAIQKGYIK